MPSLYSRINLSASDELIGNLAERYVSVRSSIEGDLKVETSPLFTSIEGFSVEGIQSIIRENSKPIRISKEKRLPFNDIYRSDLGELLLIKYF